MVSNDVFALQNAGFDAFLFAEVGPEANGSTLTVLSVLARLGQDPWAQAAQWARLPKPIIIDRLSGCIAQMPLAPKALREVRETATRLSQLLPARGKATKGDGVMPGNEPLKGIVLGIGLAIATVLSLGATWFMQPGPAAPPPSISQSVGPASSQPAASAPSD